MSTLAEQVSRSAMYQVFESYKSIPRFDGSPCIYLFVSLQQLHDTNHLMPSTKNSLLFIIEIMIHYFQSFIKHIHQINALRKMSG